jgi:hypothetical protein
MKAMILAVGQRTRARPLTLGLGPAAVAVRTGDWPDVRSRR